MQNRVRHIFSVLILFTLLLIPSRVWACACCSNTGDYHIGFAKPSPQALAILKQIRFNGSAQLFVTEAGNEESAKGLSDPNENYPLKGALVGSIWKLAFGEANRTGSLNLPMPLKMLSYSADIRDGRTGDGGGPLLYKEWRFEGLVNGTGFFKSGISGPTKYFLVLQGRGNACDNAEDFKHWRLKITGKKADYAFYGELADPDPN